MHFSTVNGIFVTTAREVTSPSQGDRHPHALTFTPRANLELLISLTSLLLNCGRKPEHPEEIQTATERAYYQMTRSFNQDCCEAGTTTPQIYSVTLYLRINT